MGQGFHFLILAEVVIDLERRNRRLQPLKDISTTVLICNARRQTIVNIGKMKNTI